MPCPEKFRESLILFGLPETLIRQINGVFQRTGGNRQEDRQQQAKTNGQKDDDHQQNRETDAEHLRQQLLATRAQNERKTAEHQLEDVIFHSR